MTPQGALYIREVKENNNVPSHCSPLRSGNIAVIVIILRLDGWMTSVLLKGRRCRSVGNTATMDHNHLKRFY